MMRGAWDTLLDFVFGPEVDDSLVEWHVDLRPLTRYEELAAAQARLVERLGREPRVFEVLVEAGFK